MEHCQHSVIYPRAVSYTHLPAAYPCAGIVDFIFFKKTMTGISKLLINPDTLSRKTNITQFVVEGYV